MYLPSTRPITMSFRLLDLAEELVLAIAQTTPLSDLLQLRLTCKTLYEICDFPLKERRHRLYLHPRSLHYAIDVCSVPRWSKDIMEIVILGNSEPSMTSRESHQFPDCLLDYHPWSQFPPTKDGERVLTHSELVEAEPNDFWQNYAVLIDALKSLPRLQTIRYAGSAVEPGYCSVSSATIMAHAKKKDLWRNSFGNSGQPQMRAALRTIWWSDAEIFTYLLARIPQTFTHVDIQQPMPALRDNGYRLGRGLNSIWSIKDFSSVTSVTYTAPGPTGWAWYVTSLLEDLPALRSLRVDVVSSSHERLLSTASSHEAASQAWEEEIDLSWNPSPIFCPRNSPNLQKITVRGSSKTPYTVVAECLTWALNPYTDKHYDLVMNDLTASNDEHGSLQDIARVTLSKGTSIVD